MESSFVVKKEQCCVIPVAVMYRVTSIVPYMGIFAIILITTRMVPAAAQDVGIATIGYDCVAQNITIISLEDIDDCNLKVEQVKTSTEKVVLLQLNKYEHVEVIQCKVEITRDVFYCGMSSHNSIINHAQYIRAITREACQTAHEFGTLSINNEVINNLQVNTTASKSLVLAGSITSNGSCEHGSFTDPYGSWPNVVASGLAKITLKTALVRANVDTDTISLPSGFRSKLSKEHCIDSDGGYTFWKSVPKKFCTDKTYSKLYEGDATKFESEKETIYSVNVDETSFSLKVTGFVVSCGATLYKTESSKLFLIKSKDLRDIERASVVDMHTDNLELFKYGNSKFLYVEPHLRPQVKSLYLDVMKHHCKLEKEMLKNTLPIAVTQPDEFAFRFMEGPGYMSVVAGEAIYIVQCVPVEVKLNHVDKCYNRLPVLRGNDTMFLTPRTRIISKYATEISCNSGLLEHYNLQGTWYKFMPHPVPAIKPMSLKRSTKITWKYQTPANQEALDLDSLSKRIMFPIEQSVDAETVAQQLSKNMEGPISFSNVFSDDIKEQIAESIWSRTWGKFIGFGTFCAGFIVFFVAFSLLKTVADAVINGYALYKVFGCSFYLIGACWDTIANILLKKGKEKKKQMKVNLSSTTLDLDDKEDIEKRTTDWEAEVQNNVCEVPVPAPRRFHE